MICFFQYANRQVHNVYLQLRTVVCFKIYVVFPLETVFCCRFAILFTARCSIYIFRTPLNHSAFRRMVACGIRA